MSLSPGICSATLSYIYLKIFICSIKFIFISSPFSLSITRSSNFFVVASISAGASTLTYGGFLIILEAVAFPICFDGKVGAFGGFAVDFVFDVTVTFRAPALCFILMFSLSDGSCLSCCRSLALAELF